MEKKGFIVQRTSIIFMASKTILIAFSAVILLSMLVFGLVPVGSSFAQENMTSAANDTGAMMSGNQTNQTGGGNQTQQGPLEQLGEALGGIFGGGGNQSQ
jgi:Flp pilus assembly protein TadG